MGAKRAVSLSLRVVDGGEVITRRMRGKGPEKVDSAAGIIET